MAPPKPLSDDFVAAASVEREKLLARLAETQEREQHFESLLAQAREEAALLSASIRDIEETVGLASQIAMCEISEELRGERIREVALEVLRAQAGEGNPIHYR